MNHANRRGSAGLLPHEDAEEDMRRSADEVRYAIKRTWKRMRSGSRLTDRQIAVALGLKESTVRRLSEDAGPVPTTETFLAGCDLFGCPEAAALILPQGLVVRRVDDPVEQRLAEAEERLAQVRAEIAALARKVAA